MEREEANELVMNALKEGVREVFEKYFELYERRTEAFERIARALEHANEKRFHSV